MFLERPDNVVACNYNDRMIVLNQLLISLLAEARRCYKDTKLAMPNARDQAGRLSDARAVARRRPLTFGLEGELDVYRAGWGPYPI